MQGLHTVTTKKQELRNNHPLSHRRLPGPTKEDKSKLHGDELLKDAHAVIAAVEKEIILPNRIVDDGVMSSQCMDGLTDADLGPIGKRLTKQQEAILAYRAHTFGDKKARKILVEKNLGLIHLVIREVKRSAIGTDLYSDLFQEGATGLWRATETFEPERGLKFSTYAANWIQARIGRYLQRNEREEAMPISDGGDLYFTEDERWGGGIGGRQVRRRNSVIHLEAPVNMSDFDTYTLGETIEDKSESPEDRLERVMEVARLNNLVERVIEECTKYGGPGSAANASKKPGRRPTGYTYAESTARREQRTAEDFSAKEGVSLEEVANAVIEHPNRREHFIRTIIEKRLLAEKEEVWTLDQIGKAMGYSREGVRLLEKQILTIARRLVMDSLSENELAERADIKPPKKLPPTPAQVKDAQRKRERRAYMRSYREKRAREDEGGTEPADVAAE